MNRLSRKPFFSYINMTDTGLNNLPLEATLYIEGMSSYYIYKDSTGVSSTTTLQEAYDNKNIIPIKWDGKEIDGFMPNPYNIPMSRAGDQSFLPLPSYTDYKGSAYPYRTRDALLTGTDGKIYMYQVRSNFVEEKVYVSAINQDLTEVNFTSFEYRPTFLKNDEWVAWIYDATPEGMCVRIYNSAGRPTKYYWIVYHNTENPIFHTYTDITSIFESSPTSPSGGYTTIIYVHELNVYLKGTTEGTLSDPTDARFVYTIFDSNLNLKITVNGLKIKWNNGDTTGGDFSFPNNVYRVYGPGYHSGYAHLEYKIDGSEIHVKNTGGMSYHVELERSYHTLEYLDYSIFNINTNTGSLVYPPGGIIDVTDLNHPFLHFGYSTGIYWYNQKIYMLFGQLYLVRTKADTSTYREILKRNLPDPAFPGDTQPYDDAFDANFYWRDFQDGKKTLIPPDNSPAGKNITKVSIARLLDTSGNPKDYAIMRGLHKDPNADSIIGGNVLISGVDINNINSYIPTKIASIDSRAEMIYFKSGENHNRAYVIDTSLTTAQAPTEIIPNSVPNSEFDNGSRDTEATVRGFYKETSLLSNTPDYTFDYNIPASLKQDIINNCHVDTENDYGSIGEWYSSSITNYPLPESNFAVITINVVFRIDPSGAGVSQRDYICIINTSNNIIVDDIEMYHEIIDALQIQTAAYPANYGIGIYDDGSDYYIWMYAEGYLPVGGNSSYGVRVSINKNNGQMLNTSIGIVGNVSRSSWEEAMVGVHPVLGFYSTDVHYPWSRLAANFRYTTSGSNLTTSFTEDATKHTTCASIRSAVGFQITFGEYPVMFNGFYEIIEFQTIEDLAPNTTYYIYIKRSSTGELVYDITTYVQPETLVNIYIGWISTDWVGVSDSKLEKYVNLNNMKLNESNNTLVVPSLTLDRIQAGGDKSLVTKEYVDSLHTVFYVDAINGDDNYLGTDINNAFKTIKHACDTVPIGGYGEIILVGGPESAQITHTIDSNIYIINKRLVIRCFMHYDYSGQPIDQNKSFVILRNISKLVDEKHCDINDNNRYSYTYGFRLYGSSIQFSGQVHNYNTSGVAYNMEALTIQTADCIPDPADGIIKHYRCSHNTGLVCNERAGGGEVEFRHIKEILLGDSHLVSQSIAYKGVDMMFTVVGKVIGNGAHERGVISFTYTGVSPVIKLNQSHVTFGNDRNGDAYDWQNSINGIVRDSYNVPRNLQSTFIF